MLEKDSDAHFYILSNDMKFCRNYGVLDDLNATFMDCELELYTMESLFHGDVFERRNLCE